MSSVSRRGFLQLVGLAATGSLVSVPLFGTTEVLAAPPSLLAGHLVIGSGFAEGRARAVMSDGSPDDFALRSGNRWVPTTSANGEDARVVVKTDFGAGLVRLKLRDVPHRQINHSLSLLPGEDAEAIAYVQARALRQEIRDAAIRTLASAPGVGQTIVTVVHEPLRWHVSSLGAAAVTLTASYDQWIVDGAVHSTEIFSETGEYPLAEKLGVDVEHLVWLDRKVLSGERPDTLTPSLLDRVRL